MSYKAMQINRVIVSKKKKHIITKLNKMYEIQYWKTSFQSLNCNWHNEIRQVKFGICFTGGFSGFILFGLGVLCLGSFFFFPFSCYFSIKKFKQLLKAHLLNQGPWSSTEHPQSILCTKNYWIFQNQEEFGRWGKQLDATEELSS